VNAEEAFVQAHPDAGRHRWWLIPLALAHVALVLVNNAALNDGSHRLSAVDHKIWFERTDTYGLSVHVEKWVSIARLCSIAMSIYLLFLLVRRDRRWPRLFVGCGVAYLVVEAALLGWYFFWGLDTDPTFEFHWKRALGCASLIAAAVAFVARSSFMRAMFEREPLVIGVGGRVGIGLAAAAVIVWPFQANLGADVIQWMSGEFSPKDTSAGIPLASAIVEASLGGGLFVMLKHACRMRNRWIAITLPIGFWVLLEAFILLSFGAHFGR
jgi:hypothetical protein